MATVTPNLNLELPLGTENVSRQLINSNNTKIDTFAGDVEEVLDSIDTRIQEIIDDTAGAGDTDKVWSADKTSSAIAQKTEIDDTAGAGDTDKVWSADKSATEVSDLKTAIIPAAFVPTGVAYPSGNVLINTLITTNGRESTSNGRACTNYINGSRIGKALSVNAPGYLFRIYYFTGNTQGTFVEYDETYYPCDGSKFAIPNPDYLYRINFYHNPVDDVAFTESEGELLANAIILYDSVSSEIQTVNSRITQEEKRISEKNIEIPVTFASRLSPIGYKGQTGNVGDTWKHTEHIDISKYEMLTYTNVQHSNSSTVVGMSFYDSNGTWIAGWKATIADAYGYILKSIPVPNNASYAVFSAYQDTATYGDFELYGILRASEYIAPQWQGKKWYAYGTSLTSTVLGQYANIVAEKLGLMLTNKGISGGGIVKDGGAIKTAVMDLTDGKLEADLITLEVGANDKDAQLGTVSSTDETTFCGALNACIRFLQENTTAQIVVMSSTPAVLYHNTPVDPSFVYPGGFTALEQVQATENVCKANGVYYIPTNEGLGMGWARIKNSMYVKDNIHHTETGGLNMAMGIISRLKDIPLWYSDASAVT